MGRFSVLGRSVMPAMTAPATSTNTSGRFQPLLRNPRASFTSGDTAPGRDDRQACRRWNDTWLPWLGGTPRVDPGGALSAIRGACAGASAAIGPERKGLLDFASGRSMNGLLAADGAAHCRIAQESVPLADAPACPDRRLLSRSWAGRRDGAAAAGVFCGIG